MYELYYVMYLIYDVIYKFCDMMHKLYDVLYELYMTHPLQFIMCQLLYMRKLFYMMWINRPSENKCNAYLRNSICRNSILVVSLLCFESFTSTDIPIEECFLHPFKLFVDLYF